MTKQSKKYTFWDDSWYDNPLCDCCIGGWVWAYNSNDTDDWLGTAHSEEDCYAHAIITELDLIDPDKCDKYWSMDIDELKVVASEVGIEVEIVS